MLKKCSDKIRRRLKRKFHIRKRLSGTSVCPRMSVFRSNKNLYVQVIDDDTSSTLVSISTMEKDFASLKPNAETGARLGAELGKRLIEKNITSVVFDRNGYLYHGVVKAIADGARSAGVKF
ncbi:MAG: 50S ribosomal protein L18 [Treponema sp.]